MAVIHKGRIVLDGTLGEIRRAVPELGESADLEDVFLRATEDAPEAGTPSA